MPLTRYLSTLAVNVSAVLVLSAAVRPRYKSPAISASLRSGNVLACASLRVMYACKSDRKSIRRAYQTSPDRRRRRSAPATDEWYARCIAFRSARGGVSHLSPTVYVYDHSSTDVVVAASTDSRLLDHHFSPRCFNAGSHTLQVPGIRLKKIIENYIKDQASLRQACKKISRQNSFLLQ